MAQALVPQALQPTLLAGKCWALLGRKDFAERIFERAHREASAPDEVAVALGSLYQKLRDENAALAWNAKVTIPSIREIQKGELLQNFGRWTEAIVAGEESIRLDPKNADAYTVLGFNLVQQGKADPAKADRAKEVLLKGLKVAPEDARLLRTAG